MTDSGIVIQSPGRPYRPGSVVGLFGCLLLLVGAFLPLWQVVLEDSEGSWNLIGYGRGDALPFLALVLISFRMVFRGYYRGLWVTATACLGFLVWIYWKLESIKGTPMLSLGRWIIDNDVYIIIPGTPQWGWLVMLAGVSLLFTSAAWPGGRSTSN